MALAPNSAAFFAHADLAVLRPLFPAGIGGDVAAAADPAAGFSLPDARSLEDAVDQVLLRWPPGSFDSTIDLVANPTRVPDSFTRGERPFGWSGFASAGPFRGLSALNNNVHALNSDTLTNAWASPAVLGVATETYIGAVLQGAPRERFRWHAGLGKAPSQVLAEADPTGGAPGINEIVVLPEFPRATRLTPHGLVVSSPGEPFWRQVNAMSAFQESLAPPSAPIRLDPALIARGADVFARAGCGACHAGEAGTNGRVLPVGEVGTEPTRARSFARTELAFAPQAHVFAFDTPVPPPPGARTIVVPPGLPPEDERLALAHGGTGGGYKVPGLRGLAWTAPYLHDGGVAVGAEAASDVGMSGTLARGVAVDARNSLRALVDRELRGRVVAANRASDEMRQVHVEGVGHELWVDAGAGYDTGEQDALVGFLLSR